jgi:ABC-type Mn2+/Zn2+ transport system permease subunit
MTWLLEPFEYEFMQRAFLVCVLIGFTNGFLGAFIVIRRLALTADALSHSLLPGLAVAAIFIGLNPVGLLLGGLVAAVIVAVGGQLITRSSRIKDETAIASLYVIAFALGVILIRYAKVKVDLDGFLFGKILGVSNSDIGISLATCAVTLATLLILQRPLLITLFESSVARSQGIPVQALLITLMILIVLAMLASLQAVGVLLSLGLLILPAATMYLLSDSYQAMSWGGAAIGVAGAVLGLLISFRANIPSGPAIVMVLGLVFLAALLFSPKYGIITRALRPRHLHDESLERWKTS